MFKHIHSFGIVVKDQDAALQWYQSVLGWEVRTDAEMGPGQQFLTIAPPGGQTEMALGNAGMFGENATNNLTVNLIVDDTDATFQELSGKGVTFTMEPEDNPWGGRGAVFVDPDGNDFFISNA